jgi:DNA invertase Pin-like site-specific DNA recombinase
MRIRHRTPATTTNSPALGYLSGPGERRAVANACERLGLQLVGVVRENAAAADGSRPILVRALDRVAAGEATCLVTSRLDGLTCGSRGLAPVLDRVDEEGLRLVVLDVGLDTSGDVGRLALARTPARDLPWMPEEEDEEEPAEEPPVLRLPPPVIETPPPVLRLVEPPPPVEEPAPAAPVEEVAPPAPAEEVAPPPPAPVVEIAPAAPVEEAPPAPAEEPAAEAPPAPARPPIRTPLSGIQARALMTIGYASVADTEAGSGAELTAQRAAIEATCKEHGLELVELVGDREPRDGKAFDRAGFSHAFQRIAAGDAACLVVAGLDRLSRSVAELGQIVRWLDTHKVRLIACDIDLDTSTPAGRKTAAALASVSDWERERLSERTRKGLAAARAKRHEGTGAQAADGAALRKRIAAMRADGMTLQAIADVLNDEGVPTQRGGAKWRPSSVQSAAGYKRPQRARSVDSLPSATRGPSTNDQ